MNELTWTKNAQMGKYLYPVNQASMRWQNLETLTDKIEACAVPDYIMQELPTEELLELVLDYPLNINIFLYTSMADGIRNIATYNPTLQAFLNRNDSAMAVQNFFNNYGQELSNSDPWQIFLKKNIMRSLLEECAPANDEFNENFINVQTPRETDVPVYDRSSQEDFSEDRKRELCKAMLDTYQGIVIMGEPTLKYNCHSFAWYEHSKRNTYWMNDPSAYWMDESYHFIGNSATADFQRIYYPATNNEHSGIVYDCNGKFVISKWGRGPLVIHKWNVCPYVFHTVNQSVNFFKKNNEMPDFQ